MTEQIAGAEPQARADGWAQENGAWRYYEGGEAATGFRDLPNRDDASRGTSRYWFEADGSLAADKAFYDRPSDGWYWVDADGTVARNKDAFVPASNTDRSHGKWVRLDAGGKMVKGQDYRKGSWYYFDPTTAAMAKGFAYVSEGSGGKWCYYDRVTGKMQYGEVYVDGAFGDEPGWCLFDGHTGAMRYGFQDLGDKTVYYDEVTGRMVHGWRNVNGSNTYFDTTTGKKLSSDEMAARLASIAQSRNGDTNGDGYVNALTSVGGRFDPYGPCMTFVWWVYHQAGYDPALADGWATGWPNDIERWYRARNRLYMSDPQPGDIWLVRQPDDYDDFGATHAGLVVSREYRDASGRPTVDVWEHVNGYVHVVHEHPNAVPNGHLVGYARTNLNR